MSLVIVDYGIGNIKSIQNAFLRLGLSQPKLSNRYSDLSTAQGLILPGVGAFSTCMDNLERLKLINLLTELVVEQKKPVLGICVGMQIMAETSTEGGLHKGFGWLPANVVRLELSESFQVPHVGWNDVTILRNDTIFENLTDGSHFYFDHNYHIECPLSYVSATVEYDKTINVAVQRENIFGVQFHPEKSANSGLKLFRGFVRYVERC